MILNKVPHSKCCTQKKKKKRKKKGKEKKKKKTGQNDVKFDLKMIERRNGMD